MKISACAFFFLACAFTGFALGSWPAAAKADEASMPTGGYQPFAFSGAAIDRQAVLSNGNRPAAAYYSVSGSAPAYAGALMPAGESLIPSRFGDVHVHAEHTDSVWRFAMTLNGQALMQTDNQPGPLQVSGAYELDGEDAIIVTALRGDASCPYRSQLIVLRDGGLAAAPRELDSCAGAPDARVANRALFIGFAAAPAGLPRWDVWRYENTELARL